MSGSEKDNLRVVIGADDYTISLVAGQRRSRSENIHNAQLIAAAPDLLAAAWRAIELINKPRNEGVMEARSVLAAAINRAGNLAEGRS